MSLTMAEWHQRYLQQARWTQSLRSYLYKKASLEHANRILDIGCGTGVLEQEISDHTSAHAFAIDIKPSPLEFARQFAPNAFYTQGDGLSLPYADHSFEVTFCHFLLLWVKDTVQTLHEMVRVTRLNGYILAIAEPDYGGRIDFPPELAKIGAWQNEALKQQGANPNMGRELRSLFQHTGLLDVEVGIMGGQWSISDTKEDVTLEWDVIRSDLQYKDEFLIEADNLEALDKSARQTGQRVLFVPTFYAIGRVEG